MDRQKLELMECKEWEMVKEFDPEVGLLIQEEVNSQKQVISLIPSENYASPLVRRVEGCILSDKNCEGYPGKRYAGGCEIADKIERLAIERLKMIFGCEYANVQSMNATIGNIAILNAVLQPGDTILSMGMADGGHLSHGSPFHISGKTFNVVNYHVDRETEMLDMDKISSLAIQNNPKLIICGASSYPRKIDFQAFAMIAKSVGATLLADISHISGLIAGGVMDSPFPYADIVSTSTHKTLRGLRGCGFIMCKEKYGKRIDREVFPGLQSAPKMDMIASRALLLKECMTDAYKRYQKQVLINAKALAAGLEDGEIRLVSGGTDTHLILADVRNQIGSGALAEDVLASVGIITNKNLIPYDPNNSSETSGIRLGSPAFTTRGLKEKEAYKIGQVVAKTLHNHKDRSVLAKLKKEVKELIEPYPLFSDEWLTE